MLERVCTKIFFTFQRIKYILIINPLFVAPRGAGPMASSLLYEVYLHAEHEEDALGSGELTLPEDFARPDTASIGNEPPSTSGKLIRTAGRFTKGLALHTARLGLQLTVTPIPGVTDEETTRPILAASARGAELIVATGKTVRAFRDEDDFQRHLAVFQIPRSNDADSGNAGLNPRNTRSGDSVALVSWAHDGSAFAVATKRGEVHVVTRVGRLVHTQFANNRPPCSRERPVAVELIPVAGGGWDLLVLTNNCAHGTKACVHVQRVFDGNVTGSSKTETHTNQGNVERATERVVSSSLPNAPFNNVLGAKWDSTSGILAVVGGDIVSTGEAPGNSRSAVCGFEGDSPSAGVWRFEGGGLAAVATRVGDVKSKVSKKTKTGVFNRVKQICAHALGSFVPSRLRLVVRVAGDALEIAAVDAVGGVHAWRCFFSDSNESTVSNESKLDLLPKRLGYGINTQSVRDVAWWSSGQLAVSFDSGDVIVMAVDGGGEENLPIENLNLLHCAQSSVEHFETVDTKGVDLTTLCGSSSASDDSTNNETYGQTPSRRVAVLELLTPTIDQKNVKWRVASIVSKTPQQALSSLLESQEWNAALDLCAKHSNVLKPDDVHKRRWRTTQPSEIRKALDTSWGEISDRAYAVVAATVAMSDSYETQRVVLEHALRETEQFLSSVSDDNGGIKSPGSSVDSTPTTSPNITPTSSFSKTKWSWWHRLRLVILAKLDRLDVSHALRLGAFGAKHWSSFSKMEMNNAAVESALRSDARGAIAIARAFPRCMLLGASDVSGSNDDLNDSTASLLQVLESFPEHMPVADYESLLPWRQPWCSNASPEVSTHRAGFRVGSNKFGSTRLADIVENAESAKALMNERNGDDSYSVAVLAQTAKISPEASELLQTSGVLLSADWLLRSTEHVLAACETIDEKFKWHCAAFHERNGCSGWALRNALRIDNDTGASETACALLNDASSALPEDRQLAELARTVKTFAAATQHCVLPDPRSVSFEIPQVSFAMERSSPRFSALKPGSYKANTPAREKRLWCASLEEFLNSSDAEKLSTVLKDGELNFEFTEQALNSDACRDLLSNPNVNGGDSLRQWLVALAHGEKFDVLAVALRWVSGGKGAGCGSLEILEGDGGMSIKSENDKNNMNEAKHDSDSMHPTNSLAWRALGCAEGVASVAQACARATPRGDDPEANAAALVAVLDAAAPSVTRVNAHRVTRAASHAAQILAASGINVTIATVLDAAENSSENDVDSTSRVNAYTDTDNKTKKPIEFMKRVAAAAVRDASGPNVFPRGGPGAWSRALWHDLSILQLALENAGVTREDAACELLEAQLRCGGGAGKADFARRTLAELWSGESSGGKQSDGNFRKQSLDDSESATAQDEEDVTVGTAVRVVAGAAAGDIVAAAGTRLRGGLGALGGIVRDARAGASGNKSIHTVLGGAIGGLVGGIGATVAEMHASGDLSGKRETLSSSAAMAKQSGPPPALPKERALKIVTSVAREFLFSAASFSDDAVGQTCEILSCAPEQVVEHTTTASESFETLNSLRAMVLTGQLLLKFGVDVAPLKLKQDGVSFSVSSDATVKFELVRLCLEHEYAYKNNAGIWSLAEVLQLTRNAHDVDNVELLLGEAALSSGDVLEAEKSVSKVIEKGMPNAWRFVSEFVQTVQSNEEKQDMLSDTRALPGIDTLRCFLAFAVAHAPVEEKPTLLSRWQKLELALVTKAAFDDSAVSQENLALTQLITGYDFLSQTVGRATADAELQKPRSQVLALVEGSDAIIPNFPGLLNIFAEAEKNNNDSSGGGKNTGTNCPAALALSYGLGTVGVAVEDCVLEPIVREITKNTVLGTTGASCAGQVNESFSNLGSTPPTANIPLGLLLGLKDSKSVTQMVDGMVSSSTSQLDPKAMLALCARAHALRLVPPSDAAKRSNALQSKELRISSEAQNIGDDHSAFRESQNRLQLLSDAEAVCGMLQEAGAIPADNQSFVNLFVADDSKRASAILMLAGAAPQFAISKGQFNASIRDTAFQIAERNGLDLTQVAVTHAAATLQTMDSTETDDLNVIRESLPFLEKQFARDPEHAIAGLTNIAWKTLQSLQSPHASYGAAHAVYYGWLKKCRLGLSANCFRAARGATDAAQKSQKEEEAKRHARNADAADAASMTAQKIESMAQRASGSYRLGPVRISAFLGKEGFDAPPGGAHEILKAFVETLSPAAAAATVSAASSAAATSAASALARAVASAPKLPPGLDELPALTSAASLAAATVTLRPDMCAGGRARASPEARWAAAAKHFCGMLPVDLAAFTRHAVFADAPHPFNRFGEVSMSKQTDQETSKSSFASEAPLAVRVAALQQALMKLNERGANSEIQGLASSIRVSLGRLELVQAVRSSTPCMTPQSLEDLEAAASEKIFSLKSLFEKWTRSGESAKAMFAFAGCDALTKHCEADSVELNPVELITNALVSATNEACASLASNSCNEKEKLTLVVLSVSLDTQTTSDDAGDAVVDTALTAVRGLVFGAIRKFASRSDVPPAARSAALEVLAEALQSQSKRTEQVTSSGHTGGHESSPVRLTTHTNPYPETVSNTEYSVALLCMRTSAAAAGLGLDPKLTEIDPTTLVDAEKSKAWFQNLLRETQSFDANAIQVFINILTLWDRGTETLAWVQHACVPGGHVMNQMRVALLLKVFEACPKNDFKSFDAALSSLVTFTGESVFSNKHEKTTAVDSGKNVSEANSGDGWGDDGWDDDGWDAKPEELLTQKSKVEKSVKAPDVDSLFSLREARALTDFAYRAGGTIACTKTALVLPFRDLWQESLVNLETELEVDDSLATLLTMRLQFIASANVNESFRRRLLETAVAKIATISESSETHALLTYAVGTLCMQRQYELATRLIFALTKTHTSITQSADAIPAVATRFLAAQSRKKNESTPRLDTRYGISEMCEVYASAYAAEACAEGLRQITRDLR